MTNLVAMTRVVGDTGVPMLYVWEPVLILALIPIIVIEMAVLHRVLKGTWIRCFVTSLIANVVSTVAGVPLTWFALVLLEMGVDGGRARGVGLYAVTVQSPWLIPYESDLHWMIPAAALVLCVPFMLASIVVEWPAVAIAFRGRPWCRTLWASVAANLVSYACLAVFWLVVLAWRR